MLKYRTYLPSPDRLALEDKINALRLDVFHKDVMNELLAEPRDDAQVDPGFYPGVLLGAQSVDTTAHSYEYLRDASAYQRAINGVGVNSTTNTSANINLSNQSIKDIAAALGAYASNTWKP